MVERLKATNLYLRRSRHESPEPINLNPKPLLLFRHDPVSERFCRDFHKLCPADASHDDQRDLLAAALLIVQCMQDELLRRDADGSRKCELLQDSAQAVGASALRIAELFTLCGKETHADRDTFAVRVGTVMEVTLDGMTDGMAEIQHLPAAIVVLVFLYEFRLLQDAPQDDLLDILLKILLCLDGF